MTDQGISILVPTRDMNHHIPGLIRNLVAQARPDLGDEILILFDGTEVSEEIRTLAGRWPFISLFRAETPVGLARGRNFLGSKAKNHILRFQDSDDLLAPYALDAARSEIAQLDEWHLLVGGQFTYHNKKYNKLVLHGTNAQFFGNLQKANLLLVNMCFFHKPSFLELGGFDEKIGFEEDWDFWLRALGHWGEGAFTKTSHIFGVYNVIDEERANKNFRKDVDGVPVREYILRKNGYDPSAVEPA